MESSFVLFFKIRSWVCVAYLKLQLGYVTISHQFHEKNKNI